VKELIARARTFPFDRVRPVVLRSVVVALVAAAAISVFSVLIGDFDDTSWKLIGTTALFIFFALCSWYDADVSARRYPVFASVSFFVSILVFAIGLVRLWGPDLSESVSPWSPFANNAVSFFWVAFVARVALLHVHLVLSTRTRLRNAVIATVSTVTLWLVVALAVLLVIPALYVGDWYGSLYWRTVTVIAILDALGTVLIPLTFALFNLGHHQPAVPVTPSATPRFQPPGEAYARPGSPLMLQWPKYQNGTPLPADADGNPDFTGVLGYDAWLARDRAMPSRTTE
jgi:hypothetical protein